MKIAPRTYTRHIRRKVFQLYKKLYRLGMDASRVNDPDEAANLLKRLDTLEGKTVTLHVPASYMTSKYHLRRNIDWIRNRLTAMQALDPSDKETPAQPAVVSKSR